MNSGELGMCTGTTPIYLDIGSHRIVLGTEQDFLCHCSMGRDNWEEVFSVPHSLISVIFCYPLMEIVSRIYVTLLLDDCYAEVL